MNLSDPDSSDRIHKSKKLPNQGGKQKKLPHRPNDLPHRPLVLFTNLPNDHGHFDEV